MLNNLLENFLNSLNIFKSAASLANLQKITSIWNN